MIKKVKRTAYDTTAAYLRKFRDAADLGSPAAGRSTDLHRTLRGVRDRHLIERLIKKGKPDDCMEAMLMVQDYESAEYQLKQTFSEVSPQPRA